MRTRIPIVAALLLWGVGARAQTTIQQESFETDGEGVRYTSTTFDLRDAGSTAQYFLRENNPVQNSSGTQTFGTNSAPSTITNTHPSGSTTSWFWASEGARGQSAPAARPAQTVTLNSVSIAGYSNLQVKVLFADARGAGYSSAAPQWETDDFVRVKVSIDGGAFTTIAQFVGDGSGNLRQDLPPFNNVSSDNLSAFVVTQALQDAPLPFSITGTGSTIRVQVEVDQIGGTEELAFDNIRLEGTLSATQAPVLANIESSFLTYNEGDPATAVTSTVTTSDADSPNLTGATVTISSGFISGQDVLSLAPNPQNGITAGAFNTTTGTLTLTGTASLASYQAALRAIKYQNTDAATATGGNRIVTFTVTDGTNTSNAVSRTIGFVAQLNGPASLPYTEDFETNGEGTRYASNSWSGLPNNCLGFLRVSTNPYTCSPVTFGNVSGSSYWYAEGTKNGANPNTIKIGNLEIAPVNATNYGNLNFNIRMGTGQAAQWENNDFVKFYYRIGTGAWTLFGAFYGNAASNGELQRDTDLNGVADGVILNSTLQAIPLALPANVTGSSVGFFIEVSCDGTEELAMDRIQITGTLNNAPVISNQAFSVNEGAAAGTVVGNVVASDPDGNSLTYAITGGNTGNAFTMVGNQLQVNTGANIDFETLASYSLTVQVTDNGVPSRNTSATVTVNVNNLTEVVSITRASTNPTNAPSVNFTVTFDQSVTGGSSSNFTLNTTGVSGASVGSVTGSGNTRTVAVNTGTGSGTIRLDMVNGTGISPATLGLPFTSGETYTVDKTAPTVSITANPPALSNSSSASFQFSGGDTGGAGLNRFEAQLDGGGFATATSPRTYTGLADGSHTFEVRSVDNAGNVSNVASYTWTIDTTPPPAPSVSTPANGSVTSNPQPPVTGTAAAGSTINVFIDGSAVGNTTADASGNWSFTLITPLAQGPHTVRATATDAAGNTSPNSNTNTFTVDTVAPTVSITANPTNPSNSSSASFSFSGTDATSGINRYEAQLDGSGFATATSPRNYTGLADGSHTFQVRSVDNAGNVSTVASYTWTIDTQVPTVNITSNPPALTNSTSASFGFTGTDGSGTGINRYEARLDGGGYTTVTSPKSYTGLADGSHTFDVRAVDNAGNTGTPDSYTWTVDATAPAAPVVVAPANGSTTGDNTPTYSGTAEPNSTVTVTVDGSSVGTTTANGAGAWSFTQPSALADGSHTVRATATDAVGNTGPNSTTNTFTVDTTAPAAPVVVAPANGSTTGDNTPTYSGTAEASSTVTVTVDGSSVGTTTANGAGAWSLTPVSPLADGSHTVRATATDMVGNTGPNSSTNTFTVDTTPPAAALVTAPTNGSLLSTNVPTYSGTAEPNSTVTVLVDGSSAGTTTANGAGAWSFTQPSALADGSHTVRARATDAAGNTGTNGPQVSFTVDTQAPAAPVVLVPANGSTTNDATPAYSGTAEAGSNVTVIVDGSTVGTVMAIGAGTWSFTQPSNLSQGPHTVKAFAKDAANNTGPDSNVNSFTVDTQAPSVVISSSTGSPTSQNPIPVNVTFSEPVTNFTAADVNVTNGLLSNFTGSDDSYAFDITPTAPGTVTVTIGANAAQDAAGNGNLAASPFSRVYQLAATATTWQGGGTTDWFTAGNWDNGVPTAALDAIIPAGAAPYPNVTAGAAIARGLTLMTGGTLTVSGGTLNLKGGIDNDGTFHHTGGLVQLSGGALQQIGGSATTTFLNLQVGAAGASLTAPVQIGQMLTLNGNLASGGNLTLLSSVAATAMVVNNGGTVSGATTVQRWVDGSVNPAVGYRHLAAPVTNTTFADLAVSGFTPTVNALYNTAPNPLNVRPYPNIFGFNEQRFPASPDFTKGYYSPTSTADPMVSGLGYSVYFPGNRLLDFVGTLGNGNVARNGLTQTGNFLANTEKSGWHLLGNPYPSPLDWDLVSVPTGMSNSVSVYQSTNASNGVYRTRANGVGSLTDGLIPMGQGIFVRVTGQAPVNFTFTNAIRATTYENPPLYRPGATAGNDPRPLISLTLRQVGAAPLEQDEAYVYFQRGATADLDNQFDGVKPARNVGVPTLLTLTPMGTELAVNGQPEAALTTGTRVPLLLSLPQAGTYELRVGQLGNLGTGTVTLVDQQSGRRQVLTPQSMLRVVAARAGDITGRYWLEFAPLNITGLAEAITDAALVVYPNPANAATAVRILGPAAGQPIELLDATGRRLRHLTAAAEGTELPLTDLAEGVYIIRSGAMTRRLVIE